jgi:hypothetical protein
MAIVIDVLVVVGTLPEADVIDDQFQMTLHRFPDRLQGLEFPVDMLVNDDFFYPHVFILESFSYCVDPRGGGDLYFEARKTLSHEVDQIGNAHGHSIGPGSVDPFKKLDQLSIAFLGILEVSETRGVEEIAELQPSIVAGLDVRFHILSFDLRKNKPGPCPTDNIKRELAEKSIYGCPFDGVQEGNIPVGTHPQFHNGLKVTRRVMCFQGSAWLLLVGSRKKPEGGISVKATIYSFDSIPFLLSPKGCS